MSNNAAPSPGPWRYDDNREVVFSLNGDEIATLSPHGSDEFIDANGRLLAEAWAMREMLVKLSNRDPRLAIVRLLARIEGATE